MRPEYNDQYCENPNYFSNVLAPTVDEKLPRPNSIPARVLDHISGVRPFLQTVSRDLCDDGRMSGESGKSALSFISRSATSAAVISATASLAALGLVIGTPALAIGAGIVGLAVLPPLAERAALGVASFAQKLLDGVRR